MDTTRPPQGKAGDHLANERTFLAWIRTSLGLMAFGFVVVKFALFLRQFAFILQGTAPALNGHSFLIGMSLVGFGVLIGGLAFVNYLLTRKRLNAGEYRSDTGLPVILTAAVVIIGVILVVYLVHSIR